MCGKSHRIYKKMYARILVEKSEYKKRYGVLIWADSVWRAFYRFRKNKKRKNARHVKSEIGFKYNLFFNRGKKKNHRQHADKLSVAVYTRCYNTLWYFVVFFSGNPKYFGRKTLGLIRFLEGEWDATETYSIVTLSLHELFRSNLWLDNYGRRRPNNYTFYCPRARNGWKFEMYPKMCFSVRHITHIDNRKPN